MKFIDQIKEMWKPFTKNLVFKKLFETKWKCTRCGQIVDMQKFRCGCKDSPSPWKQI